MKALPLILAAMSVCIASVSSLPRLHEERIPDEIVPDDSTEYEDAISYEELLADDDTEDAARELEHEAVTMDGNAVARDEVIGDNSESVRFRRSAQDKAEKDGGRGGVEVDVHRDRRKGTRVDAKASGTMWESKDGRGRVEAQGHYGRTYGGKDGTGRPQYGGSIKYSHRFPRSSD